MKKFILALLLLISVGTLEAQNTYVDSPGRWRLGLNMGALWTSSDVKAVPGLGGGFNLEKILNKRQDAIIGFSLGFRYLGGRTYGLNNAPTWGLADNKALNGTYDSTLRYDSVPGYFYANHKTFIQEGGLEFKINFPRFEQRTHLILHFWGGIGIGKFKTWIDAKDKAGNMYNFSTVKGQTVNESDLTRIYNGSYETLAEGSGTNGTIRFIPAVGIGVGFRLSKYVSFVIEHKISFPMTDYLDGYAYKGSCPNDFYHYTAANLIFTLHSSHSSSGSTNTTHTDNSVYTNTTGTTVTTGSTSVTTSTAVATHTVVETPKVYPPNVVITYPGNNYQSQYDNVSVSAQMQNVESAQNIGITLNGYPLSHFSYNPTNGMLHFQSFLALGNNFFIVSGSNGAGTASASVNVIYKPQFSDGTNTTIPTNTVVVNTNTTTTTNTVTSGGGTVGINTTHTVTTNNTGTVTINTGTTTATNTVAATNTATTTHTPTTVATNTASTTHTPTTVATNTASTTHTPTVTPTNTGTVAAGAPPQVQIINPSVNPYDEPGDSYNVSASVLNVTGNNEINITVNNMPITQFTYGQNNKMLSFFVQLQNGQNNVVITATNKYGSDSKATVITHKPGKPPKVVISHPAASPFVTFSANAMVNATVYFVQAMSDVKVTANGASVPFNFNASTGTVDVSLVLQLGNTQVTITGTNNFGSDAQSVTLTLKRANENTGGVDSTDHNTTSGGQSNTGLGAVHQKPNITVINPGNDPFQTNNANVNVVANIDFVINPSDVNVSNNGVNVSSSFNVGSNQLHFSAPLQPGMNTFLISAHNHYGTSTKSVNVNYTPVNSNPNQNNNGGGNQQNVPVKNNNVPIFNNGGGIINGNPPIKPTNTGAPNNEIKPHFNQPNGQPNNEQPKNNQSAPRTITPQSTPTVAPTNNGGAVGRPTGGGGG